MKFKIVYLSIAMLLILNSVFVAAEFWRELPDEDMAKKFLFRGKNPEELKNMNIAEFSLLLNSRERRSLKRGLTKNEKKLLERIRNSSDTDKMIRTKERDMIILPVMVGVKLGIYDGREFKNVTIESSMIGHRLGEFAPTRGRVKHSAPGLGATRSSKFVPLK